MAKKKANHLDAIFHAMGDLKKFTILQMAILQVSLIPLAYQLFANVFTCQEVPYRCASPDNLTELFRGLPGLKENLTVSYHQCHITVSHTDNSTVLREERCVYGMHYDLPKDASVISESERAKWGPGVLIGFFACLMSILLTFLPETRGRDLPQTLEDFQAWYTKPDKQGEKDPNLLTDSKLSTDV